MCPGWGFGGLRAPAVRFGVPWWPAGGLLLGVLLGSKLLWPGGAPPRPEGGGDPDGFTSSTDVRSKELDLYPFRLQEIPIKGHDAHAMVFGYQVLV